MVDGAGGNSNPNYNYYGNYSWMGLFAQAQLVVGRR